MNAPGKERIPAMKERFSALDVQFTPITDEGLRHLSAAPALELIVLDGTAITDEGLSHLAEAPTLKNIFAERTSSQGLSGLSLGINTSNITETTTEVEMSNSEARLTADVRRPLSELS
jgi:hypothetical protein